MNKTDKEKEILKETEEFISHLRKYRKKHGEEKYNALRKKILEIIDGSLDKQM